MTKSDLHSKAKHSLAEYEQFGFVPEREINIEWNEMIRDFEEGRIPKFVDKSRKVQGLARILLKNQRDFVRIRDRLKTARRLVVSGEINMASQILERAKSHLEATGREIAPVRKLHV